jgi:hypothetical protein
MRFFYKVRFYAFMFLAAVLFAEGVTIRDAVGHWLGMIGGLFGFGLNLYGQIRKASNEPYPPEIPNQRAITIALFVAMAIFLTPMMVAVVLAVLLRGKH